MERILPSTPIKLVFEIVTMGPVNLFRFIFGARLNFLDLNLFLAKLKEGYSLYRWADGETAIARGKQISYQRKDLLLEKKLKELIMKPNQKTINGLSWLYDVSLINKRWNKRLYAIGLSTRVFLCRNYEIDRSSKYVETQIWYVLSNTLPEVIDEVTSGKKVLLIASQESYLSACPSRTSFLKVKSIDAFDDYAKITKQILDWLARDSNLPATILCVAGPTSKAIVLDFRDKCQVIDVGHGFNFYFNGFGRYAWTK